MDPDAIAVGMQMAIIALCFLVVAVLIAHSAWTRHKAKTLSTLRLHVAALDAELELTIDEADDITCTLLAGAVGDQIRQFSAPPPGDDSEEAAHIAVMTAFLLAETLRQYIEYQLARPLLLAHDALEMRIASRSERQHIRARAKQAEEGAHIKLAMLWRAGVDLGQLEHLQAVTA